MNNGNLLNNLLGISGANSAVTKAASAKARAETSEKFQQALEQARPEVAARKPVARKENAANDAPSAARTAPKPIPRHNSQQEIHRADSRPKAQLNEPKAAGKTTQEPESPTAKADANTSTDTDLQDSQSADAQDQTLNEQVEPLTPTGEMPLVDPALVIAGQSGDLVSAEDVLNPDSVPLALDDPESETDIAMLVNPDGSLVLPDTRSAPLVALPAEESAVEESTAAVAGLSPLPASNQAAVGQIASAAASAQSVVGQLLLPQGNLSGDLSEKLTLDPAVEAGEGESELSDDTDSGENPDFLTLNSKAALNKLTEAVIAASVQEKPAPAADAAKPATFGAAVESLARLTEAQSPAARAFVVQTGVPVPVGTPQWSQAVGDKVLWLAAQNVSAAEIRLDPPELGPMQVRVSINQDQASVTFTSPHPVVREALDQQLNRLREMFSEQGLNLVNVDVSDKSFAQQEREQKESAKNQVNTDADEEDLVPVGLSQAISTRLVDHYA